VDRVGEALGEVAGESGHLLVDRLGGFQGVGAGQLKDGDRDRGGAIEPAAHLLIFGPEFHPSDVAEPYDA
jgi:hypothetical protein